MRDFDFYSNLDDKYEHMSAEEIDRLVAEKSGFSAKFYSRDAGLMAKFFTYESNRYFTPHVKGGWVAFRISWGGEVRAFRCSTLARVMCAAYLEWGTEYWKPAEYSEKSE